MSRKFILERESVWSNWVF